MAGPLDDLLPIRVLQIDGVDQPYAPRLNFGPEFEATLTAGATLAENSLDVGVNMTALIAALPVAEAGETADTGTDGVMTGEHAFSIARLEAPAQTVHTADGALVIQRINICTSAADGMTLPDATTNAGKSVIVINDMAATNVTITRAGSDTISGGSTSSTYVLPFGAGGVVTFIASAVSAKWYASPRLT